MKKNIFLLTFIILLFAACGGSKSESNFAPGNNESVSKEKTAITDGSQQNDISPVKKEPTVNDGKTTEENQTEIEKKIIKTASIQFGVSDYKKSKSEITAIVKKYKGFIAQENEINTSMSIGNTIVVRIPAQNFDSVINTLEGEAEKFESKTINTDDVTEEFIDIQKRLENKKKVEEQYLEYLKQAHTIPDILEVNEHIRVIREEIDAKEGRLKYLSNQVGFSTITLYIHQDFNTVSYGFFHKVGEALGGGWDGFLMFIVGLIYLWPLLLLITVLILIIRRIIKKRKTKSAKTE